MVRAASASLFGVVDQLEPRVMLAADFVAGGISFDEGGSVYFAKGSVGAGGALTGSLTRATLGSARQTEALPWDAMTALPNGGLSLTSAPGGPTYASEDGAQFLIDNRFPAGWLVGRDGTGAAVDWTAFFQTGDPLPVWVNLRHAFVDLRFAMLTPQGDVRMISARVMPQWTDSTQATLDHYTVEYDAPGGTVSSDHTVATDAQGVETLTGDMTLVLAAFPSRRFMFVDLDPSDGIVGVGVGMYVIVDGGQFNAQPSEFVGTYRASLGLAGPVGAAFLGVSAPAGDVVTPTDVHALVLALNEDGTFWISTTATFDAGQPVTIASGSWTLETITVSPTSARGQVLLTNGGGQTLRLWARQLVTRTLFPAEFGETDSVVREGTFGIAASRTSPTGHAGEIAADVDDNGHPIVYQRFTGPAVGNAEVFLDLVAETGGTPLVGEVFWSQNATVSNTQMVGGRNAAGHLVVWTQTGGMWTFTDVTALVVAAREIAEDGVWTNTNYPVPNYQGLPGAYLAKDGNGKYVAYVHDRPDASTPLGWRFVDVEADGLLGAGAVPQFVGPLAGYGTTWGGVNFAGLDAAGAVWALWWAPGLDKWSIDNVSDRAGGGPALSGTLAAVITGWSAFQITGLDQAGHVRVLWWAPATDVWQFDDLTAITGGPTLDGATAMSSVFNGSLGVINVVGADSAGVFWMYWWSAGSFWQTANITGGLDPASRPTGPLRMQWCFYDGGFAPGGTELFTQTVLGRDANGDLVRLYWQSTAADAYVLGTYADFSTPY